jgi:hypothetical protein
MEYQTIEFDEELYKLNLEENTFPEETEYGKGEDNGDN